MCIRDRLILEQDNTDRALLGRVVEVLQRTESLSAHWRPLKPLTVTSRGLVLLPQSVEVANSYLRLCALKDADTYESLFGDGLGFLRSYADWCDARLSCGFVDGPGGKWKYSGWQSEHTFVTGVID